MHPVLECIEVLYVAAVALDDAVKIEAEAAAAADTEAAAGSVQSVVVGAAKGLLHTISSRWNQGSQSSSSVSSSSTSNSSPGVMSHAPSSLLPSSLFWPIFLVASSTEGEVFIRALALIWQYEYAYRITQRREDKYRIYLIR